MAASFAFDSPAVPRYGRMRLAWCAQALWAFCRRWGIYLVIALAVLTAGAASSLDAAKALAAWSVRPLLEAALRPGGLIPAAVLLHASVGALIVRGLRPMLWPRGWADVERALPIDARERLRSDLQVVLLAMTPLFALYLAGVVVWALEAPPWLRGVRAAGLTMLVASMTMSTICGVAMVQAMRRPPRGARAGSLVRGTGSPLDARPLSAAAALLWLPLWRGPARRCALWLAGGCAVLLALDGGFALTASYAGWWLAAFALLGLSLTSRLMSLITDELAPLHDAASALPMSMPRLLRWRRGLALLPQALGLTALAAVGLWHLDLLRPAVFAAYVIAASGGALWLVATAPPAALGNGDELHATSTDMPEEDPSSRAAGWLFIGVLLIALASEVSR